VKPPAELERGSPRRRLRGYHPEQVDSLLAEVFAAYEEAWHERSFLLSREQRISHELLQGGELGKRLGETLVGAQRGAEALRQTAAAEAEAILAAARGEAEEARAASEVELERVRAGIERLRDIERELRERTRVLVEAALQRLTEEEREFVLGEPEEEGAVAAPPPGNGAGELVEAPLAAEPQVVAEATPVVSSVLVAEPEPELQLEPELELEEDTQENTLVSTAALSANGFEERPVELAERGLGGRALALSAVVLAAGIGVAVGIWQLSVRDGSADVPTTSATTIQTTSGAVAPAPASPAIAPAPAPAVESAREAPTTAPDVTDVAPPQEAELTLRAEAGDCWMIVRAGSATGKVLYEGFLAMGTAERFAGTRFWLRLGAPGNLAVTVNGRDVENFPDSTAEVIVTADGVRTVSLG
jgi:cell division initiation protein